MKKRNRIENMVIDSEEEDPFAPEEKDNNEQEADVSLGKSNGNSKGFKELNREVSKKVKK